MEENGNDEVTCLTEEIENNKTNGDLNGHLSDTPEDDKENQQVDNGEENDLDNKPSYLMYEDFSHESMGVETYSDGLQHPVELRRILTGDLSNEMTVSVRATEQDKFKQVTYTQAVEVSDPAVHRLLSGLGVSVSLKRKSNGMAAEEPPSKHGVEIYNSSGRIVNQFSNLLTSSTAGEASTSQKQQILFKPWQNLISSALEKQQETEELERNNLMMGMMSHHSAFGAAFSAPGPRRPGRPPAQTGTFDPETGALRYMCRLHCGASLASAKGRRKHEKKHCPNLGKVAQPLLRGSRVSQIDHAANALVASHGVFNFDRHALGLPVKHQKTFVCRYCGKVLKTYEGRRIHEKVQHVLKDQQAAALTQEDSKTTFAAQLQQFRNFAGIGDEMDTRFPDEMDANDMEPIEVKPKLLVASHEEIEEDEDDDDEEIEDDEDDSNTEFRGMGDDVEEIGDEEYDRMRAAIGEDQESVTPPEYQNTIGIAEDDRKESSDIG